MSTPSRGSIFVLESITNIQQFDTQFWLTTVWKRDTDGMGMNVHAHLEEYIDDCLSRNALRWTPDLISSCQKIELHERLMARKRRTIEYSVPDIVMVEQPSQYVRQSGNRMICHFPLQATPASLIVIDGIAIIETITGEELTEMITSEEVDSEQKTLIRSDFSHYEFVGIDSYQMYNKELYYVSKWRRCEGERAHSLQEFAMAVEKYFTALIKNGEVVLTIALDDNLHQLGIETDLLSDRVVSDTEGRLNEAKKRPLRASWKDGEDLYILHDALGSPVNVKADEMKVTVETAYQQSYELRVLDKSMYDAENISGELRKEDSTQPSAQAISEMARNERPKLVVEVGMIMELEGDEFDGVLLPIDNEYYPVEPFLNIIPERLHHKFNHYSRRALLYFNPFEQSDLPVGTVLPVWNLQQFVAISTLDYEDESNENAALAQARLGRNARRVFNHMGKSRMMVGFSMPSGTTNHKEQVMMLLHYLTQHVDKHRDQRIALAVSNKRHMNLVAEVLGGMSKELEMDQLEEWRNGLMGMLTNYDEETDEECMRINELCDEMVEQLRSFGAQVPCRIPTEEIEATAEVVGLSWPTYPPSSKHRTVVDFAIQSEMPSHDLVFTLTNVWLADKNRASYQAHEHVTMTGRYPLPPFATLLLEPHRRCFGFIIGEVNKVDSEQPIDMEQRSCLSRVFKYTAQLAIASGLKSLTILLQGFAALGWNTPTVLQCILWGMASQLPSNVLERVTIVVKDEKSLENVLGRYPRQVEVTHSLGLTCLLPSHLKDYPPSPAELHHMEASFCALRYYAKLQRGHVHDESSLATRSVRIQVGDSSDGNRRVPTKSMEPPVSLPYSKVVANMTKRVPVDSESWQQPATGFFTSSHARDPQSGDAGTSRQQQTEYFDDPFAWSSQSRSTVSPSNELRKEYSREPKKVFISIYVGREECNVIGVPCDKNLKLISEKPNENQRANLEMQRAEMLLFLNAYDTADTLPPGVAVPIMTTHDSRLIGLYTNEEEDVTLLKNKLFSMYKMFIEVATSDGFESTHVFVFLHGAHENDVRGSVQSALLGIMTGIKFNDFSSSSELHIVLHPSTDGERQALVDELGEEQVCYGEEEIKEKMGKLNDILKIQELKNDEVERIARLSKLFAISVRSEVPPPITRRPSLERITREPTGPSWGEAVTSSTMSISVTRDAKFHDVLFVPCDETLTPYSNIFSKDELQLPTSRIKEILEPILHLSNVSRTNLPHGVGILCPSSQASRQIPKAYALVKFDFSHFLEDRRYTKLDKTRTVRAVGTATSLVAHVKLPSLVIDLDTITDLQHKNAANVFEIFLSGIAAYFNEGCVRDINFVCKDKSLRETLLGVLGKEKYILTKRNIEEFQKKFNADTSKDRQDVNYMMFMDSALHAAQYLGRRQRLPAEKERESRRKTRRGRKTGGQDATVAMELDDESDGEERVTWKRVVFGEEKRRVDKRSQQGAVLGKAETESEQGPQDVAMEE